jgi:hypothetical protein
MADFKQALNAKREAEAKARLDKRMAKLSEDEKGSLRAPVRIKKVKVDDEPILGLHELELPRVIKSRLTQITEELGVLNGALSAIVKRKAILQDDAKELLKAYGKLTFMVGEERVSHFPTTRSTVKADLLMQAKVPISVIKACTKTSTSWSFKVTQAGEPVDLDDLD